jgi:hypothetical protein
MTAQFIGSANVVVIQTRDRNTSAVSGEYEHLQGKTCPMLSLTYSERSAERFQMYVKRLKRQYSQPPYHVHDSDMLEDSDALGPQAVALPGIPVYW